MSAEDLGRRLSAEVEEVGFDEILNAMRVRDQSQPGYFGLQPLDDLVKASKEAQTIRPQQTSIPIVELMSATPGSGKTHIIYHLAAVAVVPRSFGGRQAAAIIIDADYQFSVPRLRQHIQELVFVKYKQEDGQASLHEILLEALAHVHVFRPHSLSSCISSIQKLQGYLFDMNAHQSYNRSVAFLALDSVSTFYWQSRADTEEAALVSNPKSVPRPNDFVQLAAALKTASKALNAPVIFTTWYQGPPKDTTSAAADLCSFRSSLPPPWPMLPILRLFMQRLPMRKLPMETCIQEAFLERGKAKKTLKQGRFECFINGYGMDERTAHKLRASRSGFEFHIREQGFSLPNTAEDDENDRQSA